MTSSTISDFSFTLNLRDCIQDTADNFVFESPEYCDVPADVFELLLFQALEELVEDFSTNPSKYLKSNHLEHIERTAKLAMQRRNHILQRCQVELSEYEADYKAYCD